MLTKTLIVISLLLICYFLLKWNKKNKLQKKINVLFYSISKIENQIENKKIVTNNFLKDILKFYIEDQQSNFCLHLVSQKDILFSEIDFLFLDNKRIKLLPVTKENLINFENAYNNNKNIFQKICSLSDIFSDINKNRNYQSVHFVEYCWKILNEIPDKNQILSQKMLSIHKKIILGKKIVDFTKEIISLYDEHLFFKKTIQKDTFASVH